MTPLDSTATRRAFLRFLAASPLWGSLGLRAGAQDDGLIGTPAEALNVFDFEPVARKVLPPAHWGYLATGVDDDNTLVANREAFSKIAIRARRLVDVRTVDMSCEIFGERWETPIVIAPAGSQKAFHPDGEVAVARAARAKRHLQILSTVTTSSLKDVIAARGGPVWYQLYPTAEWRVTERLLARADGAGCPVVVLTVDLNGGSNRETLRRYEKLDTRDCTACHQPEFKQYVSRKPMFDGIDVTGVEELIPSGLTWEFLERVKGRTKMKLVVKGLVTAEDAELAVKHGADGIIVSNHGGRAEESDRGTIDSLPEVVNAVDGRVPVLVDSGFRRGTDIFKALALGARAVCIGRPYLWGLAAFGQPGVERVLELLRAELALAMKQAGATVASKIDRDFVAR